MDSLSQKVKKALLKRFTESDIRLEDPDDDKIIGFVISTAFKGRSSFTRQKMIWAVLNKHLDMDERRRIAAIIAMTPEEEVAYSE